MKRSIVVLLPSLVALAACSLAPPAAPEATSSAWLEVPEGTPVYEYDMLPVDQRAGELALVPEMVIAERPGDARYSFGQAPPTVAIDDGGQLFVYDAGNYRVAVFDADGEFLYEFGGRGAGPGEFASDRRAPVGFLGESLYIYFGYRRMGFWTPQGGFLRAYEHRVREGRVVPLDDGTMLASTTTPILPEFLTGRRTRSSQSEYTVAKFALTDAGVEAVALYAAVPAGLYPGFTGMASGEAYISTILGDTTQISSFTPAAAVRWIARLRQPRGTQVMPAELLLDGDGRVYVMPRVNRLDAAPVERTIDVLDDDGAHLAALRMPDLPINIMWQRARGGFVYGVQADPVTYEWQVARFRVRFPSDE